MCWLRIRQLTVVGIVEYADMPDQLYGKGDYVSQLYQADRDPGNKEVGIRGNRSPNTLSFGHLYCKPFPSHPRALLPRPGGGRPVFMAKTSSLSSVLARLASSYTSCGLRSRWTPPAKQGFAHTSQHCASSSTSNNSIWSMPGKRRRSCTRNAVRKSWLLQPITDPAALSARTVRLLAKLQFG